MSTKKSHNFDQFTLDLIEQKNASVFSDLEKIRDVIKNNDYEAFISDVIACDAAERWFERAVGRLIDINLHLIRQCGEKTPASYKKSFYTLANLGIITRTMADDISPCTGTRNILVHEYDDLDTMQFYESLQKAVELFPKYIRAVREHVEKNQ